MKQMKKIEAPSLDAALLAASAEFGCSVTDLEYEIIQNPSSGVLGFGRKNAVICVLQKSANVENTSTKNIESKSIESKNIESNEKPSAQNSQNLKDFQNKENDLSTQSLKQEQSEECSSADYKQQSSQNPQNPKTTPYQSQANTRYSNSNYQNSNFQNSNFQNEQNTNQNAQEQDRFSSFNNYEPKISQAAQTNSAFAEPSSFNAYNSNNSNSNYTQTSNFSSERYKNENFTRHTPRYHDEPLNHKFQEPYRVVDPNKKEDESELSLKVGTRRLGSAEEAIYDEPQNRYESERDWDGICREIKGEIERLFACAPFVIDEVIVEPFDENTIYIKIDGEDSALLIGKEGYRYNAISYLLFNWLNHNYGLMVRLEIAQFLENQEAMISALLAPTIDLINSSGRGQTRPFDGVLAHIALRQLREAFPDKYVAMRGEEGERYIIVNEFYK